MREDDVDVALKVVGKVQQLVFALAIQQKGKMRMLAVASEKRLPQFPDVPTFKELGVDWVDGAYRGIGVPKSTPPELRKQISDLIDQINKEPDTRKRMYELGFEVTDIKAFCARLEADGVKLDGEVREVPNLGLTIAFLTDPWGTRVELTEGLAKH